MLCSRYSHVKDLLDHYALDLDFADVTTILDNGVDNESDAELLCKFIWQMVVKMSEDCRLGRTVLGSIDNSDLLPDVAYEITSYLSKAGYIDIWDRVSNTEAP